MSPDSRKSIRNKSFCNEEAQQRLEEALSAIVPVCSGHGIPYNQTNSMIVRELLLSARSDRIDTYEYERGLQKKAAALIKVMDTCSEEQLRSLGFDQAHRDAIDGWAKRPPKDDQGVGHEKKSSPDIANSKNRGTPNKKEALRGKANVKKKRGAPEKMAAFAITCRVAREYYRLSGKRPTIIHGSANAPGPFVKLLRTVFDVLGVKASALSMTRMLLAAGIEVHLS